MQNYTIFSYCNRENDIWGLLKIKNDYTGIYKSFTNRFACHWALLWVDLYFLFYIFYIQYLTFQMYCNTPHL